MGVGHVFTIVQATHVIIDAVFFSIGTSSDSNQERVI